MTGHPHIHMAQKLTQPRRATERLLGTEGWRTLVQLVPVILLIILFFVLPLCLALWGSVDGTRLHVGRYAEIFTDPLYRNVLARTFVIATSVTAACILLGYPIAYLLIILSRRWSTVLAICLLVPLFTAFLIRIYGWMTILGRAGVINTILRNLDLIERPIRLLGTETAVYIGMIHVLAPIAIFTMYASMIRLDRSPMNAAKVLGATPVQAFTRVYLPMSLPGVVSASVLVFITALGFFIAPVLLGSPSDTMIAQLIVTQINTLANLEFGYALATVLLAVIIVTLLISNLFVPIEHMWAPRPAPRRRGAVGIGVPQRLLRWLLGRCEKVLHALLGRPNWLWPVLLRIYGGLMVAFMLAPLVVVYILSFSSSPFLVFPPPGFSLQWYEKFFASADWREALFMSLRLAFFVASVAVVIAGAAAFALVRGRFIGKRALFMLIVAPLLVPVIIVALCLYVALGDIGLLGSFVGLIIGHLIVAVPYAVIILVGAVRGLDRNLEYAAATLGARPFLVLRKVVLPSLAPALVNAWVMAFLSSFDELLVTLFLIGRQTPTLQIKMWSNVQIQLDPVISAASSSIVTVIALVIIATQLRSLLSGRVARRPAA